MWIDLPYRIFAFVWLGAIKGVRAHYQRVAGFSGVREALRENLGDTVLGAVLVLIWEVGIGVYLFYPPWLQWAALDLSPWLRWSGAALGAPALALLIAAHQALGRNFSVTLRVREDHRLVTEGPYYWIRHPIYLMTLIQSVSTFLLTANIFIGVTWFGGALLLFALRIPREEASLERRFGDRFRSYRERTGRLLPRLRATG